MKIALKSSIINKIAKNFQKRLVNFINITIKNHYYFIIKAAIYTLISISIQMCFNYFLNKE